LYSLSYGPPLDSFFLGCITLSNKHSFTPGNLELYVLGTLSNRRSFTPGILELYVLSTLSNRHCFTPGILELYLLSTLSNRHYITPGNLELYVLSTLSNRHFFFISVVQVLTSKLLNTKTSASQSGTSAVRIRSARCGDITFRIHKVSERSRRSC